MKRVFIVSPYSGDLTANTRLAEELCYAAVLHGYAPFAGHLFFTRFLRDFNVTERNLGMRAAYAWLETADEVWVVPDGELSAGMKADVRMATALGKPIIGYGSMKEVWNGLAEEARRPGGNDRDGERRDRVDVGGRRPAADDASAPEAVQGVPGGPPAGTRGPDAERIQTLDALTKLTNALNAREDARAPGDASARREDASILASAVIRNESNPALGPSTLPEAEHGLLAILAALVFCSCCKKVIARSEAARHPQDVGAAARVVCSPCARQLRLR